MSKKVKQPKVKQPKVKKPIYKKWWFYVLIILIIFIIAGAVGSSSKNKATEEPAAASSVSQITEISEAPSVSEDEEATEDTSEQTLSFILMDGELGDYGEEVTLNAGTEFEEVEIMYHIPAGLYSVKNLNPDGGEQVTVYSGAPVLNGEWEEFVADDECQRPIVVMGGEAKDLEIKEGQFVVLADRGSNLEFTMK